MSSPGKAYTVPYEAVNAMLLNESLKKHHRCWLTSAFAAPADEDA
jgi:hypothetical protein